MTRTSSYTPRIGAIPASKPAPSSCFGKQKRRSCFGRWHCEFIAASRKLAPYGLTAEEAWDQLSHYLAAFRLVVPAPAVLERARDLHTRGQWSFWDAMIVAACQGAGVSLIYSEDLPRGMGAGGPDTINPFR